jgi:gamma-glutamyltranspeptidase / glutathione hydrolase
VGGVIAAGHPLTARAGADILREGGNAVDAAVAAMLMSWVAEPALTGPGAGGYMMVARPGEQPVVLDFFMAVPSGRPGASLRPADVSFGDAVQVFHVGAASVGVPGNPHGIWSASERFGTVPLEDLAAPAARCAREGVPVNPEQGHILEILSPITRGVAERFILRPGEIFRDRELAETIERLGADGADPFYRGDVAGAIADHLRERGGAVGADDLAAYETRVRDPVEVGYRDRRVVTNPPPNAGGILLAFALSVLGEDVGPAGLLEAMDRAQAERTPEFVSGLGDPAFVESYRASRLGSTTHLSVVDADGMACSVTCTNGEGSGEVVEGTGIHLNNVMGEEDLSPLGFFTHPAGLRLPSMMAPTMVLCDQVPELVMGSAGSNRIRSTLLQVIVNVVDHGMEAVEAVEAPRLHLEGRIVYVEPGLDPGDVGEREVIRFRDRNVFFGGCQVVQLTRRGELAGAGDPRRGGAVATA